MVTHESLPVEWELVVAQIEGRFYPVHVRGRSALGEGEVKLDFSPQCSWEVEHACGIPFAVGLSPTEGVISFGTYSQALEFCSRKVENRKLWSAWEVLATQSELYPERNAWYRDEIVRLTQRQPRIEAIVDFVFGCVSLGNELCSIEGSTIDEAWVKLYARVCWLIITPQEVA